MVNKIQVKEFRLKLDPEDNKHVIATVRYYLTDSPDIVVEEREELTDWEGEYNLLDRSFWPEGIDFT